MMGWIIRKNMEGERTKEMITFEIIIVIVKKRGRSGEQKRRLLTRILRKLEQRQENISNNVIWKRVTNSFRS